MSYTILEVNDELDYNYDVCSKNSFFSSNETKISFAYLYIISLFTIMLGFLLVIFSFVQDNHIQFKIEVIKTLALINDKFDICDKLDIEQVNLLKIRKIVSEIGCYNENDSSQESDSNLSGEYTESGSGSGSENENSFSEVSEQQSESDSDDQVNTMKFI